jgi:flagellar hook assembly protein FlgD
VSGQVLPGSYSITWNAADNAGNSVGTGVYYCRLSSLQGNASVQRLVLLR